MRASTSILNATKKYNVISQWLGPAVLVCKDLTECRIAVNPLNRFRVEKGDYGDD